MTSEQLESATGKRQHDRLPSTWIERLVSHVVMLELELRGSWREVFLTPANHPRVQINSDVPLWRSGLLDELPRDPAVPTAEIENGSQAPRRQVWNTGPPVELSNASKSVGPTSLRISMGGTGRSNRGVIHRG